MKNKFKLPAASAFSGKLEPNPTMKRVAGEILANAVLVHLALESMSHRSISGGLASAFGNPLMFLCSIALLSLFLSASLLMPKRHLGYFLVDTVWLVLGAINFILLGFRTTPLTAMDFRMLTSVFTVVGRYLNNFQLTLFFAGLAALGVLIVWIATKLPRTRMKPLGGLAAFGVSLAVMTGSFQWAMATGAVTRNFGNIADAFSDYGFAYSFATSVVDKGISQPKAYSEELVAELVHSLDAIAAEAPAKDSNPSMPEDAPAQEMPNLIMVQLESFFDAKRIKALSMNTDPVPHMTALAGSHSSGYVTVPSIGAGTANTEFEILTGMSLDYFGAGEYPYKTILAESTVESFAYVLSDLGYHTQAIHNNMGTFYSRNSVYKRLGFDGFTSIEYMEDVQYNPIGWAKDGILVGEILKTLETTPQQDFIFTVSVQPHGKYPEEPILENPPIAISLAPSIPPMNSGEGLAEASGAAHPDSEGAVAAEESAPLEETAYNKYAYYVNQLHETDAFVGALVKALSSYPEPVAVLFYGDHLPTLDITETDLSEGSPFQTEYVLWDNMGLDRMEQDLESYQLGAMVMERLGIDNGLINKFHQTRQDDPDYEAELELLQYDVLYGSKNAYGGTSPYKQKAMAMGISPITIDAAVHQGEAVIVSGSCFTPWSEVFMDGVQMDTIFIDPATLIVPAEALEAGTELKVVQVTETGKKLGSTAAYIAGGNPWKRTSGQVR